MSNQVFVAWTDFQRRQLSMADCFGFEVVFLPARVTGRLGKALEYVAQILRTLRLLVSRRPKVLWLQLPPTPLLWTAILFRRIYAPELLIVADCHNAMLRPPWVSFPGVRLLRKCHLVLVHNQAVYSDAAKIGVALERLLVLEDAPARISPVAPPRAFDGIPRPWVLLPASFKSDEPIEEVLQAAILAPEISFLLTGNPDRARKRFEGLKVPDNVYRLGFLAKDQFDSLLAHCDAVLGLTKFDGIQLSVCNEAVGAGKPMILSDTKLLRHLFGRGSVFVDSFDPQALAAGCRAALAQLETLTHQVLALREERTACWREVQAAAAARALGIELR